MSLAVPFPWKFGTAFQASNSVPGCFLRLSNWASSRCGSRSCPKEPAKGVVGPDDSLHGKTEGMGAGIERRRRGLKQLQQRWSLVPRHRLRTMNDIVAHKRADGYKDRLDGVAGIGRDLFEQKLEVALDQAEAQLIVADQVHLVDGNQNVPHPQIGRASCRE